MFHTPNAILRRSISHSEVGFARGDGINSALWTTEEVMLRQRGNFYGVKALRCLGFWHRFSWLHDSGWHLSYFGNAKFNMKKIASFSDGVNLGVGPEGTEEVQNFSCEISIHVCAYLFLFMHVHMRIFENFMFAYT